MRKQQPAREGGHKLIDIIETELTHSLPVLSEALATKGFLVASQVTSREEVQAFFRDVFYLDSEWQEQSLTSDMVSGIVMDVSELRLEYWEWNKVECRIPLVRWKGGFGDEAYRVYFNGIDPGICLGLFVGVGVNTRMYV